MSRCIKGNKYMPCNCERCTSALWNDYENPLTFSDKVVNYVGLVAMILAWVVILAFVVACLT